MDSVAFIITEYLGLPETFIYEEIKNLKKFNPVVLTHSVINTDIFPLDNIIKLKEGLWKIDKSNSSGTLNPLAKIKNLKHHLTAYYYFKNLIKKENIKIVHAQYGSDGVYSLPLKEKFNLPLVTSFRGYDTSKAPRKNPGMYEKLFEVGDIFLVRSNSMREDIILLGCPNEKIIVHHSSIDLNKFKYVEREPLDQKSIIKILFVGRLVEKKGILDAVRAFAKVSKKKSNVHLTVIGDGPLKKKAIELADTLGALNKLTFRGSVTPENIPEEMNKHHIFLLPCKTSEDGDKEGIPNSIKEAEATGMPVVSTLHSGIPEAVLDGKTGYLVREGDINAIVDRLLYLIGHQDLWAQLGRLGRQHMEKECV